MTPVAKVMRIVLMRSPLLPAGLLAAAALALSACGSTEAGAGTGSGPGRAGEGVEVLASFYPLQYAAQRVGGDRVTVTNMTRAGAEPHDLELTPRDVAAVSEADLVVHLSGFQPAVDAAARDQAGDRALDVADAARLDLEGHDEHAEEEAHAAEGEHAEAKDPHFWLDPTRLADVGDALAARLATVDPQGAATYRANAASLRTDLTALDREFEAGLAGCANRALVTSHEAFGYLAQRYRLEQVGIGGLSPEAEPDAATLAKAADFVKARSVRTIYYETLVSPAVARTVAAETGARTAVLDPIEGLSDQSAAQDYLGVMRANLAALRAGQPCS